MTSPWNVLQNISGNNSVENPRKAIWKSRFIHNTVIRYLLTTAEITVATRLWLSINHVISATWRHGTKWSTNDIDFNEYTSLPLMNTKSWIFSCKSLHHMKCSKTACLLVSQPVTVLVSLTVLRLIVSPTIGKTDNESKGLTTIAIGQGMRVRLTTIMLLLSLLHSTKTQPNYKQTGWQVLYMSARVIALILSHNWKCDNPLHESPTNQKQYMYIKNKIKEDRRSVSPAWQQWLPAQQARCQHDHRVDNESEGLIRIPEGLTVQHVCLTTIMSLL